MTFMLTKILKALSLIADDVVLVIGVTCLTFGVFQIYVPAGYIVLGLCFIVMAYLMATRKDL